MIEKKGKTIPDSQKLDLITDLINECLNLQTKIIYNKIKSDFSYDNVREAYRTFWITAKKVAETEREDFHN